MSNTSFCRTASWKEKVCMSRLICAANIFTLGSTCSPCRTATTTTISPLFFQHERPYKPEALHVPTIFFLFCTRTTNDYANSVSAARGWLVGIPESGWLPVQNCSQSLRKITFGTQLILLNFAQQHSAIYCPGMQVFGLHHKKLLFHPAPNPILL